MVKNQKLSNKTILTDIDGVVLNWQYAFHIWMQEHKYVAVDDWKDHYGVEKIYSIDGEHAFSLVQLFNESAAIGFLPPLRDAMHYIKRLHEEHGYTFHAITSVSDDENTIKLRTMNLHKLFGETTFESIVCLGCAAPKHDILQSYANNGFNGYWIEDKVSNAVAGANLGFKTLLMEHGHNMHRLDDKYNIVKNWKEIYEIILNDT